MIKNITLEFKGYTWDKYLYLIAEKKGILIIYSGRLDKEGKVKVDKILNVSCERKIGDVFESDFLESLRSSLSISQMLFYSYAEIDEQDGINVAKIMNNILLSDIANDQNDYNIKCHGDCSLFPVNLIG